MKEILVTGGAGYKGVVLVEALLNEGYHVTLVDNFMYGYESVLGFLDHKNCRIIKLDIRNIKEADVKDFDVIYHLAGISGYPACDANPYTAGDINVLATRRLAKLLAKNQILVYASTTSFYGKSSVMQDETSPIRSVSHYGKTKYEAEQICMGRENSIALRFATIFGASRKMRCDLMLNDFVLKAMTDRGVILFDKDSLRTFIHIKDVAQAYLLVLKHPKKMRDQIYNVGSSDMNYSKIQLARKVKNYINFTIANSDIEDLDKRDFIISFDKIAALGFKPKITIDDGIKELMKLYSFYRPFSFYNTI